MTQAKTESDLIQEYHSLAALHDQLEEQTKEVSEKIEKIRYQLYEQLTEQGATSTAKYEGVGFASLAKARLFASYDKDAEEQVFAFISDLEPDLIKPSVHSSSLSSFVGRLIDEGKPIPDFIKYYQKPQVRFYK